MRYSRLRLRSSILFSLTALILFFLLTLHTLLWSTAELEPPEQALIRHKPPSGIPFWSALHQPNVYDLQATDSNKLTNRSSPITRQRINELFELVRNARNNQLDSSNLKKDSDHDRKWSFEKFVGQKPQTGSNDTNAHTDTADSAGVQGTKSNIQSKFTTIEKLTNEHDKIQLRYFILDALLKWKKQHMNDKNISLGDVMQDSLAQDEPERLNTTWFQYIKTITNFHVYDPNSSELKNVLKHLQHGTISEANEMSQGTQIKLLLELPNGFQGLLKPYRVPRNYQTQPDHFYFSDVERHHAEIAAFHVDKVLGFNRVPPLIGRFFNITSDIREKATAELAKTFFISPAHNTCFRGHCSYYCDTSHAVCGKPGDLLEGSVQVLLPRPPEINWQKITHPYRRSYSSIKQVEWESNENFCYEHVMIDEDYHNRLLLDMMDLSAFDFLIGNLDRHHMMRINSLGTNTGLIHLDNGRSFGRYDSDDLSILTPIRQCCFFRYATFMRLYKIYHQGFSKLVADSLDTGETLQTILVEEHLEALDRRLEILFAHLDTCMKKHKVSGVMIDDGIY
ncbi:unnamed protein product [Rotaria magnacalcarata]|uniref:FAM20 C-terminal domain-containing protein n=3 Tax=Rotaria magnacalcarata TaxID=392030 RepID=A0A816P277_9BILA|nr:unnamed protein product [Rotaria magnacalcarata]